MVSHSLSLLSPISRNSPASLSSDSSSFAGAACCRAISPRLIKPPVRSRKLRKPLSASLSLKPSSFFGASSAVAKVEDGSPEQFLRNNSIADFMRFRRGVDNGGGNGELQTAVVSYRKNFPWSLLRPFLQVDLVSTIHIADKEFYSNVWLQEDPDRVPPHRDSEVSIERMKCYRRFYQSEEDLSIVMDEYASFSLMIGLFEESISIFKRNNADPTTWWANFGSQAPLLQDLAFRVLGQPTSSSCCERNWSTYSFVHSLKRNKLTPKRAEDLVFVHNNLRLLSRNANEYLDERTKMWDVGGDEFGTLEYTGFLEMAELSLNEPELESVLFSNIAS